MHAVMKNDKPTGTFYDFVSPSIIAHHASRGEEIIEIESYYFDNEDKIKVDVAEDEYEGKDHYVASIKVVEKK